MHWITLLIITKYFSETSALTVISTGKLFIFFIPEFGIRSAPITQINDTDSKI